MMQGQQPMMAQQPNQPMMQQAAAPAAAAPAGGAPVAPAQPAAAGAPQFASLYVGDLDAEVTEAMLYEIFNTVGPVASIRVCRDSVSRRSLGYAYVNFHSAADAERVMDTLNYSTIKGRCCRIMWSHRDPNLRKTGNGNVFVKNLDKNVDNKALYDTFSLFGNILSCKVATESDGKSRGYGFVHYETAEAAKQAIEKVNGMQIGEKTVYVGEFIPRDGRAPTEITNFTNLYIKNFPEDWTEEKLLEEFKKFGSVTSHQFTADKKGRNFCFLNYETPEEARAAIEEWHGKDSRTEEEIKENPEGPKKDETDKGIPADDHPEHLMYVARAQSKAEREAALKAKFAKPSAADAASPDGSPTDQPQQGVNLYIKNLSDDVTDVTLREMFQQFGEITSAKIMIDGKTRSKGFGFVCYKTPDEATKAVTEMHLKVVKGKPLYVGLAEKKDDRQNRLAQRYKGEKGMNMNMGVQSKGGLITYDANGKGAQPQMMQQPQMMGQQMMGKGQAYPMMQQPGMFQMQQKGGAIFPGQQQGAIFPGQQPMQQPGMQPGMMQPGMMQQPGQPMMAGRPMMMGAPQPGQPARPMMMGGGAPQQQWQQGAPGAPMMGKGQPQMMQQPMKGGPQMQQPGMMKGAPQQPGQPQAGGGQQLSAQMLANAPPGMQKQMLGEKLYPAVSRLQPELAGKITGMMLEMDNSELLMMLESEAQLRQKVDEALRVLQQMNNK